MMLMYLSIYRDAKLVRSVSMSSLIESVCYGGDDTTIGSSDGDTDDGSGGEGDLDLLRIKDSKSDGGAGLTGKVVILLSESDMMTSEANTLACGVVTGKRMG
nr:hypothetical protein [Tanacetum cinerariifolium]GEZ76538.1 hypothetical protein [Tanacetum cinerariifolium]